MPLWCESEFVDKLEKLAAHRGSENVNDARKDEMLARISVANQLKDANDLPAANKILANVFEYVDKHMDIVDPAVISALCQSKAHILCRENVDKHMDIVDPAVISSLCQNKAHILCREKGAESALRFFQLSEEFANTVNFHDRLAVLYLRLGVNMDSKHEPLSLFQPDAFYEDIQKWLISDARHRTGLAEFIKQAPQAKTFYDGIRAIFGKEKVDLAGNQWLNSCFEEKVISMADPHWKSVQEMLEKNDRDDASEKFQGIIKQLIEHEKQQGNNVSSPSPLPLTSSCYILLLFAKSLQLIEQGYYHEARETIMQCRLPEYRHLSTYICSRIANNKGRVDQGL